MSLHLPSFPSRPFVASALLPRASRSFVRSHYSLGQFLVPFVFGPIISIDASFRVFRSSSRGKEASEQRARGVQAGSARPPWRESKLTVCSPFPPPTATTVPTTHYAAFRRRCPADMERHSSCPTTDLVRFSPSTRHARADRRLSTADFLLPIRLRPALPLHLRRSRHLPCLTHRRSATTSLQRG